MAYLKANFFPLTIPTLGFKIELQVVGINIIF